MKTTIHPGSKRGFANHGWLKSAHSFSFANFYDPAKMNFGMLRVLNDDFVEKGMGFGAHPHDNMEIISIALEGELEHQDSMGNKAVIKPNEVQIMSAGTGITHSEKNKSQTNAVKFLQIWIMPKLKNITPRYDQQYFEPLERLNKFQVLVSPDHLKEEGVKINQNAWFTRIDADNDLEETYTLNQRGNGVYLFLLEGKVAVGDQILDSRDALGVENVEEINLKLSKGAQLLIMEVPMS